MKNSLAPSKVTTRDPKGLKFMSIVEAAYNKADLSDEEAQRINETPGLADLVTNFIAENRFTDQFKNEEVASSYSYLSGYSPKPVADQIACLKQLFPEGRGYRRRNRAGERKPQTHGKAHCRASEVRSVIHGRGDSGRVRLPRRHRSPGILAEPLAPSNCCHLRFHNASVPLGGSFNHGRCSVGACANTSMAGGAA